MVDTLLKLLLALALLYAAAIAAIWWYARRLGEPATLREAARFGPDLLRLVRGLRGAGAVTRRGRLALGALALYLVMPIDLVPDPIPLIGWADDLVIVVLVLRAVTRRAGAILIREHWSGGPAGLAVLLRLLRLSDRGASGRA